MLISGYAAVFNNVDLAGDIIAPGAFNFSSHEHISVLFNHDRFYPIGKVRSLVQDDYGLKLTASLYPDRYINPRISPELMSGLSIGYRTRDFQPRPGGGRLITRIDLYEISICSMPLNPLARYTVVEGFELNPSTIRKDHIECPPHITAGGSHDQPGSSAAAR